MKAVIISQESISSTWTFEAMKRYFDEVDSLNLKEMEISLGTKTEILYKGEAMGDYDCIYVKGSFRYAEILASITAFYQNKKFVPITTRAFSIAHDKMLTHIHMQLHDVPQPTTFFSPNAKAGKKILKDVKFPVIMKLPRGTQGKGVMFADSYPSASSMLDTLESLQQPFLIQEYVDTEGEDIRAIVVGDRVVAAMKRKAQEDEKRSNIHTGGQGSAFKPDSYLEKVAVRAAKAIGADICGVDILESMKGPIVLEANLSPGLQGITKATGIDVADKIAKYLYEGTKKLMQERKDKDNKRVLNELWVGNGDVPAQEIVANLDFRGERILLPDFVKRISKFTDKDEVIIKVSKGKISIENFRLS